MGIKAVEEGKPLSEFWTEASALSSSGLGASPWYWETVYRTNGQTAYNTGRSAEFARVQPAYLEFVGIEDVRQTTICRQRSGTILPATHPFWKSNWPPLHYNCRSTVRAVSQEEVDLMREADPGWQPTDGGNLAPDIPPQGFGGNPISTGSFYKLTPSMIDRAKKYGILDDIKALGKSLGLRYDAVQLSTIANEGGVSSISASIPESNVDRSAFRKMAQKNLRAQQGSVITNTELGEGITLAKTGIDHAVSFSGESAKLAILDHIPEILASASSFKSEPENKGNPDITEILKGKVAIEINGERNLFAVILRRLKSDGTLSFYDILPWEQK
jgi:SPP1 gp7 family putative phage head morphogenesis protein